MFLVAAESIHAQPRPPSNRQGLTFARFVPASAKLFVRVRRLGDVDAAMHRAHAWRLLPVLAGGPLEGQVSFDLRAAVTSFLGPKTSINIDELMQSEVGIAASSWSQFSESVWFVRIADEAVVRRWFPKDRRAAESRMGLAQYVRTRDGMGVLVRGGILAMSRPRRIGSLFRQTARLMLGRGGKSLQQSVDYTGLTAYLPARALGVAYLVEAGDLPADIASFSAYWPALQRVAVGMYEDRGRIDFAVRGVRAAPKRLRPTSAEAVDRLTKLPHTTLFASVATVDFDQIDEDTAPGQDQLLRRFLRQIGAFGTRPEDPSAVYKHLGPQVIFAWGQSLGQTGATPQLALLVQCDNAQAVAREALSIADRILELIGILDPVGPEAAPTIVQSHHLGTRIMHVPLGAYARRSRFSSAPFFEELDPAWAVWDRWFIITLSRDHLERILDAQHGLIRTLQTVADVRGLQNTRASRSLVAIGQAGLASEVLGRWLADYEAGVASLLDPSSWSDPFRAQTLSLMRLGIDLRAKPEPGAAIVDRIHTGKPAEGHLKPMDRVVALDGHPLDLSEPNADLRRLLRIRSDRQAATLRVLREGRFLDVTLTGLGPAVSRRTPMMLPAQAVAELASLGNTLEFATFVVHALPGTDYSARLSLRFERARAR